MPFYLFKDSFFLPFIRRSFHSVRVPSFVSNLKRKVLICRFRCVNRCKIFLEKSKKNDAKLISRKYLSQHLKGFFDIIMKEKKLIH